MEKNNSICVVVVFNHRYDKNIAKIRKIYDGRFSKILFLVPFYDGHDLDVIPVYESSYQFQGYFIQAYEKLMETGCQYFLLIADDMILNPKYNETNILSNLGMENKKVGIDYIHQVNMKGGFVWYHARYSSRPFFHRGVEWKQNLPSYEEALRLFEKFWNMQYPEKYEEDFYVPAVGEPEEIFLKEKKFFEERNRGDVIPYPMARGYSDILFVRRDIMQSLLHTMGIFSAMNLFVEIAIPTSIVLTVPRNEVTFFCDLPDRTRKLMWNKETLSEFSEKYANNYKKMAESWEDSWMYAHPIKLSSWEV